MNALISLDHSIVETVTAWRVPWLNSIFLELTKLGHVWVAGGAVIGFFIYFLLFRRDLRAGLGLVCSYLGSAYSVVLLKDAVLRIRPVAPFALITERFSSFPSLHATLSVSVYALTIFLFLRRTHSRHKRRIGISIAISLVLLIGFSRLYLGVHYPLDILGGYLIGFVFLYLGRKIGGR